MVVVSHSHFIRKFCSTYIDQSADSAASTDHFARKLCSTNIGNASCVAVDIDFTAPHGRFGSPQDTAAATAAAASGHRSCDGEQ